MAYFGAPHAQGLQDHDRGGSDAAERSGLFLRQAIGGCDAEICRGLPGGHAAVIKGIAKPSMADKTNIAGL
jgi:hypothetical protein